MTPFEMGAERARKKSKKFALGVPPDPHPSKNPSSLDDKDSASAVTGIHSAPSADPAGQDSNKMPQRGSNQVKTAAWLTGVDEMRSIADENRKKRSTIADQSGIPKGGRNSGLDPWDDKKLFRRYGQADDMLDEGSPVEQLTAGTPDNGGASEAGSGNMNKSAQMAEPVKPAQPAKPARPMDHKQLVDTKWSSKNPWGKTFAPKVAGIETAFEKLSFKDPGKKRQSHQRYMANRFKHIQRSRMYRMGHKSQIKRSKKRYARQVKMKSRRPKRRIGTAGGGYSFIMR